jgi:hypothetical protein
MGVSVADMVNLLEKLHAEQFIHQQRKQKRRNPKRRTTIRK